MKKFFLLLLVSMLALTPARVSGMIPRGEGAAAETGKEEKSGDKKLDLAKATKARTEEEQIKAAQRDALQGSVNPDTENNSEVVEEENTVTREENVDFQPNPLEQSAWDRLQPAAKVASAAFNELLKLPRDEEGNILEPSKQEELRTKILDLLKKYEDQRQAWIAQATSQRLAEVKTLEKATKPITFEIVKDLDVTTEKDGAVFWTGYTLENQRTAMAYAAEQGKKTIEMTRDGKLLDQLGMYKEDSPIATPIVNEKNEFVFNEEGEKKCKSKLGDLLFDAVSTKFAQGAHGKVTAVIYKPRTLDEQAAYQRSAYARIEEPILLAREQAGEPVELGNGRVEVPVDITLPALRKLIKENIELTEQNVELTKKDTLSTKKSATAVRILTETPSEEALAKINKVLDESQNSIDQKTETPQKTNVSSKKSRKKSATDQQTQTSGKYNQGQPPDGNGVTPEANNTTPSQQDSHNASKQTDGVATEAPPPQNTFDGINAEEVPTHNGHQRSENFNHNSKWWPKKLKFLLTDLILSSAIFYTTCHLSDFSNSYIELQKSDHLEKQQASNFSPIPRHNNFSLFHESDLITSHRTNPFHLYLTTLPARNELVPFFSNEEITKALEAANSSNQHWRHVAPLNGSIDAFTHLSQNISLQEGELKHLHDGISFTILPNQSISIAKEKNPLLNQQNQQKLAPNNITSLGSSPQDETHRPEEPPPGEQDGPSWEPYLWGAAAAATLARSGFYLKKKIETLQEEISKSEQEASKASNIQETVEGVSNVRSALLNAIESHRPLNEIFKNEYYKKWENSKTTWDRRAALLSNLQRAHNEANDLNKLEAALNNSNFQVVNPATLKQNSWELLWNTLCHDHRSQWNTTLKGIENFNLEAIKHLEKQVLGEEANQPPNLQNTITNVENVQKKINELIQPYNEPIKKIEGEYYKKLKALKATWDKRAPLLSQLECAHQKVERAKDLPTLEGALRNLTFQTDDLAIVEKNSWESLWNKLCQNHRYQWNTTLKGRELKAPNAAERKTEAITLKGRELKARSAAESAAERTEAIKAGLILGTAMGVVAYGGYSGAVVGAAYGSALGPIGTAIGGILGGLVGFTASLNATGKVGVLVIEK